MRSSFQRFLEDSDGLQLNAATKTATFNSEPLNIGSYNQVGLAINIANAGGTSPTLDVSMQFSPDNGVTWLDVYPVSENSETQATFTQITANGAAMKFFPVWSAAMNHSRVRFVFTIAGTSPTFDISAWVICRDLARGAA